MIGDERGAIESFDQIRLIDFGLSSKYKTEDNKHIEFSSRQDFIGNMALSSKYAMSFYTLGRRDDLISLTYLLIYMVQGYLEFLNIEEQNNEEMFSVIL